MEVKREEGKDGWIKGGGNITMGTSSIILLDRSYMDTKLYYIFIIDI